MSNRKDVISSSCRILLCIWLMSTGVLAANQKAAKTEDARVTSTASAIKPSSAPLNSTPTVIPVPAGDSVNKQSGTLRTPNTGEQIKWQVISAGGGKAGSPSYIAYCTVGQTAVGVSSSPSFKVSQGFWQQFQSGCCNALTGNVDCDQLDAVDISDLSALIDNLYISFTPLCCPAEANIDGQPGIDISDLSALIDYLYITFTPTAACQ